MFSKFQSRVFSFTRATKSAGCIRMPESNTRWSAPSIISFTWVPPIFCDLLDRTHAVELGCELRLGDGQPQVLHSLKSVAGVSRNGGGIIRSAVPKFRKLNEAQGRQCPLIDIELARERSGEVRKRSLMK